MVLKRKTRGKENFGGARNDGGVGMCRDIKLADCWEGYRTSLPLGGTVLWLRLSVKETEDWRRLWWVNVGRSWGIRYIGRHNGEGWLIRSYLELGSVFLSGQLRSCLLFLRVRLVLGDGNWGTAFVF